jgi:HEAT repeat protein
MLIAIYAIAAIQVLIVVVAAALLLSRVFSRLAVLHRHRIRRRLEPLVLDLLMDPTMVGPLANSQTGIEGRVLMELLLRQASELAGTDRQHMSGVFDELGLTAKEVRALRSRRLARRLEAAGNLGVMGGERVVPALVESLRDPSEGVRLSALQSLGEVGAIDGISVLMDLLDTELQLSPGRTVEAVLESKLDISALVLPRLSTSTTSQSRRMLAQLSGSLPIIEASGLLHLYLHDTDPDVRISAAEALGQIGNPESFEPLDLLLKDSDPNVRAASCRALGAVGDPKAISGLRQSLDDPNVNVRRAAARAMVRLGPDGVDALEEAASGEQSMAQLAADPILAEMHLGL